MIKLYIIISFIISFILSLYQVNGNWVQRNGKNIFLNPEDKTTTSSPSSSLPLQIQIINVIFEHINATYHTVILSLIYFNNRNRNRY